MTEQYLIPGIDYCPHCFDHISDTEMIIETCKNCGRAWNANDTEPAQGSMSEAEYNYQIALMEYEND